MKEKRILYFDCASGISGDMVLGALLDLGADEGILRRELAKLCIDGLELVSEETQKNGIRAKHVHVLVHGEEAERAREHEHGAEREPDTDHAHTMEHDHTAGHVHGADHGQEAGHTHGDSHGHGHLHGAHVHRNFADIRAMIEGSGLKPQVKELSLRIFGRVAAAEAKVHGKSVDEVHFHEVGAVDSIADIVGCAILIDQLKPREIYASILHEGHGTIQCQHGLLSVPVPATSEILASAGVRLQQIDVEGELVTPTGAAIITELAKGFGVMPPMRLACVGWGAGTKDFSIPNVLKVYEGYAPEEPWSHTAPEGLEPGRIVRSGGAGGGKSPEEGEQAPGTADIPRFKRQAQPGNMPLHKPAGLGEDGLKKKFKRVVSEPMEELGEERYRELALFAHRDQRIKQRGTAQEAEAILALFGENQEDGEAGVEDAGEGCRSEVQEKGVAAVQEGYPAGENAPGKDERLHDEVTVLETSLDDCTGEQLGYAMQVLMEAGALDAYYTPVYMKKNRPAWHLTVLARPEDADRLERLIFKHTTTIGIRRHTEQRSILKRAKKEIATPYGRLEVKEISLGEKTRLYPEYESAVKLAKEGDVSLWEIYGNMETGLSK